MEAVIKYTFEGLASGGGLSVVLFGLLLLSNWVWWRVLQRVMDERAAAWKQHNALLRETLDGMNSVTTAIELLTAKLGADR